MFYHTVHLFGPVTFLLFFRPFPFNRQQFPVVPLSESPPTGLPVISFLHAVQHGFDTCSILELLVRNLSAEFKEYFKSSL